jgi:hypothetical protein
MFEELIDPIEEKTRQIKERIALFKKEHPWLWDENYKVCTKPSGIR